MKLISWCSLIVALYVIGGEAMAFYFGDISPPGPNEAHIGKTAIVMPLDKILLVRKDKEYCAIKFTKFWTGKTEDDLFASYESYCQGNTNSNFHNGNIKTNKKELSFPKPRGIGRLAFSFGNKEIECGSIKLFWSGQGAVHFYRKGQDQGDYGVELAPTNWNNIAEIIVSDSRLRWYRYDDKRKRENINLREISHP